MKHVLTGDLFVGGDTSETEDYPCMCQVKEFVDVYNPIANLERPIISAVFSADILVPFAPPEPINDLIGMQTDGVDLANNYIHDKGNEGISDILGLLEANLISVFGAGQNLREISKPVWLSGQICVLGYYLYNSPTLNWIQRGTQDQPGVNPLSYEKNRH